MLEKILLEVCHQMATVLEKEQLEKLKNVLFMNFHDKKIVEEKNELIVAETDSDLEKLKLFVASKKVSGRKDNTLKQYVNELKYCRNVINKKFEDITTMDLRWYLGIMQEQRGNSMSTIQNKIRYLNSFYSFLVKEELVSKNPVARIEAPKQETIIRNPFTSQNMEAIKQACQNLRDRAIIEFLYSTGLRVSEVCSLKVGDIDFSRQEFMVMGKGHKERKAYISDVACYHLKAYLKWRIKNEGIKWEESKNNPLFVSAKKPHKALSKNGIEYLCRELGKIAGIANVHPHRFRRTFATDMLNRGMKIEELAKLMGHTKIETTMIYCSILQENIKSAYHKCA